MTNGLLSCLVIIIVKETRKSSWCVHAQRMDVHLLSSPFIRSFLVIPSIKGQGILPQQWVMKCNEALTWKGVLLCYLHTTVAFAGIMVYIKLGSISSWRNVGPAPRVEHGTAKKQGQDNRLLGGPKMAQVTSHNRVVINLDWLHKKAKVNKGCHFSFWETYFFYPLLMIEINRPASIAFSKSFVLEHLPSWKARISLSINLNSSQDGVTRSLDENFFNK